MGAYWTLGSAEYESAGWDEATHLADVGLYYLWAAAPYSCYRQDTECPDAPGEFNLQLEPTPNCALPDSEAIVGNHVKYHWDNYDYNIDYLGEILSLPVYDSIDTLAIYPALSGEGGIDESWNLTRTEIDDLEGRSTQDFANYAFLPGMNTSVNLAVNCGSAGD